MLTCGAPLTAPVLPWTRPIDVWVSHCRGIGWRSRGTSHKRDKAIVPIPQNTDVPPERQTGSPPCSYPIINLALVYLTVGANVQGFRMTNGPLNTRAKNKIFAFIGRSGTETGRLFYGRHAPIERIKNAEECRPSVALKHFVYDDSIT